MHKNFLYIAIVLIANFEYIYSQEIKPGSSIDRVVAIVNDQIILHSDFKEKKLTEKDSCIADCELLKKILIEKMLLAKAEKDSIMVSDEEVEGEIDRRMAYFTSIFGSQDKLEKYYDKSIDQLKIYFKDDVKNKLRADRTKLKLFGGIQPSPKEVKQFFEQKNPDSIPYINAELQLQQIVFFPKITRENKRISREKALQIHKKLLSKEADLSTQAILYSDDQGTAANGGELGWISHGQMVPEFEQAAYSTKIGDISDIIETRFGYHIIEVLDKKNDKVRVRHVLITPKSNDKDYTEVALLADSVYKMLKNNKIQFEKAVEIYSDDDIFKQFGGMLYNMKNKSTNFDFADLDLNLQNNIKNLKPGEFTTPTEYVSPQSEKVGYRIVKVVEEIPPHKMDLTSDFNKIKHEYLEQFLAKETKTWFNNYKHMLYMRIDPEFSKCPDIK